MKTTNLFASSATKRKHCTFKMIAISLYNCDANRRSCNMKMKKRNIVLCHSSEKCLFLLPAISVLLLYNEHTWQLALA